MITSKKTKRGYAYTVTEYGNTCTYSSKSFTKVRQASARELISNKVNGAIITHADITNNIKMI